MSEDILGIKINKDLQWFKITLANGEEIDLVKKQDYIKLQNNWNELKKWLEAEIKHLEKSRYVSFNEYGENKLKFFKDFQFKMQELEKKQ